MEVIQQAFNLYSDPVSEKMSLTDFSKMLSVLKSSHPELDVNEESIVSVFSLLDEDNDGCLSFVEFWRWFHKKNRYAIFETKCISNITKAHRLFLIYSQRSGTTRPKSVPELDLKKLQRGRRSSSPLRVDPACGRYLTPDGFLSLCTHLEIKVDEDTIKNNSKTLTFSQFCKWLKFV